MDAIQELGPEHVAELAAPFIRTLLGWPCGYLMKLWRAMRSNGLVSESELAELPDELREQTDPER